MIVLRTESAQNEIKCPYFLFIIFDINIYMGAIRSLPQNQVITSSGNSQDYYYITASVCGWQYFMQDFQLSLTDSKTKLFALIDGHNGPEVAELLQIKLPELFRKNDLIKNLGQTLMGLENIVYELDQLIFRSHFQLNEIRAKYGLPALSKQQNTKSGCGLVIVAFNQQQIIIANVGLCKCYITYKKDKSRAILFSGNHIASNKQEQARVLRNNGFIFNGRVNGIYPFTRSFGDYQIKKGFDSKQKKDKNSSYEGIITSQPSFFSLRRQDIKSVILGSSGLWEKPQMIGKTLSSLNKGKEKDLQCVEQLLSKLIAVQPSQQKQGLQNMSLTYINFCD